MTALHPIGSLIKYKAPADLTNAASSPRDQDHTTVWEVIEHVQVCDYLGAPPRWAEVLRFIGVEQRT